MWGEILLSLGTSIFEYGLCTVIDLKERKNMREELNKELDALFLKFADSSIDTDEFFALINSYKFKELLHNYFYTLKDGLGTKEYRQTVIEYICQSCSKAQLQDINSFFDQIEALYSNFLIRKIEEDPKLNALFQLLTVSHRSVISKLSEGIDEIIKNINSAESKKISIDDSNIKDYHHVCENEYGVIRFTGISGAERKADQDINTFYVENKFSFYNVINSGIYNNTTIGIDSIGLKDLFSFGNKIVIVGAGGFGKTTSLNYLYCNYENIYGEHPLKIKIDLKEYSESIVRDRKDILSCIADQFYKKTKRTSGLEIKDIELLLSEFLESGRCLVIFDALDEISTQDARNAIRTEVANFCELYYMNRYIITTREVGYLKNKFDNSFVHFKINQFTRQQIRLYSKNWFKFYRSNTKFTDFNAFWRVFSTEVNKAHCRNLISNPIMLILALVIFDTNQSLPSKKVEFYEKCIATFLSERQIQRGLQKLTLRAQNILGSEMVIPRVAHYKYCKTNENSSYKFTSVQLKDSVLDAIEVPDRINWNQPAEEYIQYLIERTELICEVDEEALDFAHKTFFEYFLAIYFSKQLGTNILQRQLLKWIGDANNHELAKLIIEIIILKGEPYRQDEIMGSLFNVLKMQKAPKKHDVLHLLIELYDENILPPKYHNSYYEILLNNGDILRDIISRFGRRGKYNDFDKFDVQQLAALYCEKSEQIEDFYNTIETIYHLNDDFKHAVIEKNGDNTLFKNVTTIFSFAKKLDFLEEKRETSLELKKNIKYFEDEHYVSYAINSPLIFVSLVRVLTYYNLFPFLNISRFISTKIDQNDYFYKYSTPSDLINLINFSRTSKDLFALLLIIMVLCSKGGTNIMIGYVLKHGISEETDSKEIADFTKWIYHSLNCEGEYIAFENEIKDKGLFDNEYVKIYEKAYNLYISYESEIEDERIIDYLESIESRTD